MGDKDRPMLWARHLTAWTGHRVRAGGRRLALGASPLSRGNVLRKGLSPCHFGYKAPQRRPEEMNTRRTRRRRRGPARPKAVPASGSPSLCLRGRARSAHGGPRSGPGERPAGCDIHQRRTHTPNSQKAAVEWNHLTAGRWTSRGPCGPRSSALPAAARARGWGRHQCHPGAKERAWLYPPPPTESRPPGGLRTLRLTSLTWGHSAGHLPEL